MEYNYRVAECTNSGRQMARAINCLPWHFTLAGLGINLTSYHPSGAQNFEVSAICLENLWISAI
jgi:hypothetical protein